MHSTSKDLDFAAAQPPLSSRSSVIGCLKFNEVVQDNCIDQTSVEAILNEVDISKYQWQDTPKGEGQTSPSSSTHVNKLCPVAPTLEKEFQSSNSIVFTKYESRIKELRKNSYKCDLDMSKKTCITPENIFKYAIEYRKERPELLSLSFAEILLSMLHSQNYYPGLHWLVRAPSDLDVERANILWRCKLHPSTTTKDDVMKIFYDNSS